MECYFFHLILQIFNTFQKWNNYHNNYSHRSKFSINHIILFALIHQYENYRAFQQHYFLAFYDLNFGHFGYDLRVDTSKGRVLIMLDFLIEVIFMSQIDHFQYQQHVNC
ncbi:hypothetical protein ACJX0J_011422 [Zea mays]